MYVNTLSDQYAINLHCITNADNRKFVTSVYVFFVSVISLFVSPIKFRVRWYNYFIRK